MLEGKETKMDDFQRIENDDHCTEGRRKVYSDLVDCPTQLICTWVFTCVLHVFHDKARRTQQGNLLTLHTPEEFFSPSPHVRGGPHILPGWNNVPHVLQF